MDRNRQFHHTVRIIVSLKKNTFVYKWGNYPLHTLVMQNDPLLPLNSTNVQLSQFIIKEKLKFVNINLFKKHIIYLFKKQIVYRFTLI